LLIGVRLDEDTRHANLNIVVNVLPMRVVALLSIVLMSSLGAAAESVQIDEGLKMVVEGENLSLLFQGKPIWTHLLKRSEKAVPKKLTVHRITGPATAVHVKADSETGATREWVFLVKQGRSRVHLVWEGETDLKGDLGERTGRAVRFEDLTGDGKPEIVLGEISEAITLCGKNAKPLLFRNVFDIESGSFRPVLAKRPGLAAPKNIDGVVREEKPRHPIAETLVAACASRSPEDGGQVMGIPKPTAAVDGKRDTAWRPWPPNGAGEFITFTAMATAYGITEVGIQPSHGTYKKRRYDRPKSLLMTTDKGVYRLRFTSDPESHPNGTFWFSFKEPLKTSCLSFIVETSYASPKGLPLGLSEVMVKTELDGPDGLTRLAADLGDNRLRRAASILLKKIGKPALAPLTKVWDTLDTPGRRLAVDVIAEVDPEGGVDLLVDAALGRDAVAKETALKGLKRAPQVAMPALESALTSKNPQTGSAAVEILQFLGTSESIALLTKHAGKGDKAWRRLIRKGLRALVGRSEAETELLWTAVTHAATEEEWEKRIDLLRVAVSVPSLHERIFEMVEKLLDRKDRFEDRYRLLSIVGQLGCEFPRERLLTATSDADPQIRVIAIMGFGACTPLKEDAMNAIVVALDDRETPVRLAALSVIATGSTPNIADQTILRLSSSDPWPQVRASAVAAVFGLPADRAMPVLERAVRDGAPMVRKAALEGATRFTQKRADAIIEYILKNTEESAALKTKAAMASGRRCQRNALPLLFALLKEGAEPLADQDAIETAVAAARAMGHIGTPEAKQMLKKARTRSNPATDKAIDAALQMKITCGKTE
jgi:HEAT repeat protein